MVGVVVVSHSERAAEGIVEVAAEMGGDARIEAVGGDRDGGIGTSMDAIRAGIEAAADDGGGVVVLVDLGSAVMNAEIAIEKASIEGDVEIADAPVLEGALNAAVEATNPNATVESVLEAATDAREYRKL
ncbi:PTS mannose transporter subunit IID [Halobacteriales archaeon QS_3_64_16]|nr:MAG: PTS mannose transporter subunit IID [Halobacteriales archaeon QS_3_64_16]